MGTVTAVELNSVSVSLFLLQKYQPLQSWLGVMVLMLRHLRAQDCPDWELEKSYSQSIFLFQKIRFL